MAELELIWAIVVSTALVILTVLLWRLQHKHNADIRELLSKHKEDRSMSRMLGINTVRGELNEILGTFKLLTEYDQLAIVTGATSPSLDLIGIKEDSLDFIEIKSLGTKIQGPQKKVRDLIQEKKVRYVIMEGNLPKSFEITERK